MVVFVPTFQRPGPLVWSLRSVLLQAPPAAATSARVVVLNNGTPPQEVEQAVALAEREAPRHGWAVSVVHRDPPMDPALSWYGGIAEHCADGDLAFLHGDDDLLLPSAVALRCEALLASGRSCLLSQSRGGLFFDGPAAEVAFLDQVPPPLPSPAPWRAVGPGEIGSFGAAFIGNHCYRNDQRFRRAVELAIGWMRTLPLQGSQQLAMLPYFLPVAVADAGGLAGTDAAFTLRGQSTQDLAGRRFGHSFWRPGVLYGACLHVLLRGPLAGRPELEPLRRELRALAANWRLPTLTSPTSRREWQQLDGDGLLRAGGPIPWGAAGRGAVMVARAYTGTQALGARLWRWRHGYRRDELLSTLWRASATGDGA